VQHEPGEKCARTRAKRPKRAAVRTSYPLPYSSVALYLQFGKIKVTDFARKGPFFRTLLEKELARIETSASDEEIAKKLQGLGYLD
jgi:hypothetical protein